jgi:hypothetical protein
VIVVERNHDYIVIDRPFRRSRAGAALQNQGVDPCARDFGDCCGRNGIYARSERLVCRPDRCHHRDMSANRLFFWNWRSSSPSGGRLAQEVDAPGLLAHAGTTCRALIGPCLIPPVNENAVILSHNVGRIAAGVIAAAAPLPSNSSRFLPAYTAESTCERFSSRPLFAHPKSQIVN